MTSAPDHVGASDEGESDRRRLGAGGAGVEDITPAGRHQTAQQRRLLHRERGQAADLHRRQAGAEGQQGEAEQQRGGGGERVAGWAGRHVRTQTCGHTSHSLPFASSGKRTHTFMRMSTHGLLHPASYTCTHACTLVQMYLHIHSCTHPYTRPLTINNSIERLGSVALKTF